ncbi:uncharacterized protein [Musca autumnalis]|uniref:uncharacterized protein n=1 Tax=Musca autumnalis TaxID=221902 RepID=UPI003CE8ED86
MKFKQKICANHKYKCSSTSQAAVHDPRIFYTLAVIMIFMNAAVSVKTSAAAAVVAVGVHEEPGLVDGATTMLQILDNNTNQNPIIAQQSAKTSAPQYQPETSILSYKNHSDTDIVATITTSFTMPKTNSITHSVTDSSRSNIEPLGQGNTASNCKSLTGTWGDVDPNIYYLCDMETKQAIQLPCPDGRGYFNGLGYSGCIPYEQWPACVTQQAMEQVHICDSDHMQQPWETMNPNKFYICLQEAVEPMLLNCGQGKGFVHVRVSGSGRDNVGPDADGDSEIVGCANWEKWRSYMQCTDYY